MPTTPGSGRSGQHDTRHPGPGRLCAGRACAAVLLACFFLVGGVISAPLASAHDGDPSSEGYLLVQQALGHLVHDPGNVGPALEKVDAALAAPDQDGVAVPEVQQAKVALQAGGTGTGAWLSISAALAITAGTLISRQVKGDVLPVIAWHFLIGGVILALAAGLTEGVPAINWSARFIGILLYISLVGTAAAFLGWFTEVRHCRLDAVSAWTFLVPVFGILLSIVVLGEHQTFWSMAGMVLVIVSMLTLILPGRRRMVQEPGNPSGQ